MASTYSNLGIELIADGEQSAKWGDTTNDNLKMLDAAISQRAIVAIANKDITLTMDNGAFCDARKAILKFTGALTADRTISIEPADLKKMYFVENATTGGKNIIIKQGPGTGGEKATIAPGGIAHIFCDGTGADPDVIILSLRYGEHADKRIFIGPQEMTLDKAETNWATGQSGHPLNPKLSEGVGTTDQNIATWDYPKSGAKWTFFTLIMPWDWDEGDLTYQPIYSCANTPAAATRVVNSGLTPFTMNNGANLASGANDTTGSIETLTTITKKDIVYYGAKSTAFKVKAKAGELVQFRFRRDISGGPDTMPHVARLHGIMLNYHGAG